MIEVGSPATTDTEVAFDAYYPFKANDVPARVLHFYNTF